jgi:hypothetical protein
MTKRLATVLVVGSMVLARGCGSGGDDDGAASDADSDGDTDGDTDGDADGDTDSPMECPWPAGPTHVPFGNEASLSVIFRRGDALFTRWYGAGMSGGAVSVFRTDLPGMEHTLVWEGDAAHDLLGASEEFLFVGRRNEEPRYLEVKVLDHDGALARTAPLGALTAGIGAFRVDDRLYVTAGGELHAEADGVFEPLGLHGDFASHESAPEILVFDGVDRSLCALDAEEAALQPCVQVPASFQGTGSWLDVVRARRHGGEFAITGLVESGQVIAVDTGGGFEVLALTSHQWTVNGLDATPDGWLWLRQESPDMNEFLTRAVHWVEGTGAQDVWEVEGQAFGTAPGECGFALAIKQQGLHLVGYP